MTYHKAFPFYLKIEYQFHVIHLRTIFQNFTKIITKFLNYYQRVILCKIIILDLAI